MYSVASFQLGPNDVSPVRIKQSIPSEMALEMSATSERDGRSLVIIESMISVDRMQGFLTLLHLLIIYCWIKAMSSI